MNTCWWFFFESTFSQVLYHYACLRIPKRAPSSFFWQIQSFGIWWFVKLKLIWCTLVTKIKQSMLFWYFSTLTLQQSKSIWKSKGKVVVASGWRWCKCIFSYYPIWEEEVWLSEFLTDNINQCTQICFCKFYIGKFWERRKDI